MWESVDFSISVYKFMVFHKNNLIFFIASGYHRLFKLIILTTIIFVLNWRWPIFLNLKVPHVVYQNVYLLFRWMLQSSALDLLDKIKLPTKLKYHKWELVLLVPPLKLIGRVNLKLRLSYTKDIKLISHHQKIKY